MGIVTDYRIIKAFKDIADIYQERRNGIRVELGGANNLLNEEAIGSLNCVPEMATILASSEKGYIAFVSTSESLVSSLMEEIQKVWGDEYPAPELADSRGHYIIEWDPEAFDSWESETIATGKIAQGTRQFVRDRLQNLKHDLEAMKKEEKEGVPEEVEAPSPLVESGSGVGYRWKFR